jgi:cation diffusion facilitator family transporter
MSADRTLERYAWLSLAAALVTIVLKTLAWYVTDSVGLLSDALESLINLAAALLALSMLRLAATPPDARHPYGRFKAEYFASGAEGALIVFAAAGIAYAAAPRLASRIRSTRRRSAWRSRSQPRRSTSACPFGSYRWAGACTASRLRGMATTS